MMVNMEVREFGQLCRTCMSKKDEMKPLFGNTSDNDVHPIYMLEACTSLLFKQEDPLPSQICGECLVALRNAFDFRKRCENVDTTLREILQQSAEDYAETQNSEDVSQDFKKYVDENYGKVGEHFLVESTELGDNSDHDNNCTANSVSEEDELKIPDVQGRSEGISCGICNKKLCNRTVLKRHMLIHNPEKAAYQCSICEKSYSRKDSLAQHELTHKDNKDDMKSMTCEICGKVMASSGNLTIHMKQHKGIRDFMCTFCGKVFITDGARLVHERVHTGEKPYKCEVCGKTFKQHIGNHMRTHTGEKPFECTECGQKCFTSSHLKLHMRIHTGEKPHKCKICSKTFRFVNSLKVHEKAHTGEYEHFCSICNKGFYMSSKLKNHMRMHTGEKPYPCKICGKTFSESTYRSIHMKKVHKKRAKEEPINADGNEVK